MDGAIGSTFERRGRHPGAAGPDSMRLDDRNTAEPLPRHSRDRMAEGGDKCGGQRMAVPPWSLVPWRPQRPPGGGAVQWAAAWAIPWRRPVGSGAGQPPEVHTGAGSSRHRRPVERGCRLQWRRHMVVSRRLAALLGLPGPGGLSGCPLRRGPGAVPRRWRRAGRMPAASAQLAPGRR